MTPQDPSDPNNQGGVPPEPIPPQQPYGQQPYTPNYQSPPPPGYQQPGAYGGYPGAGTYVEQINGTTILVLGIVSILCFQIILGPIAWVMGNNAITAINAGRANPAELGNVSTGRICGIVGTVLGIVGILGWILYVVVFAGMLAATHPMR